MYIRWHGYSCYEFSDENNKVIIDPHDGKSIGVYPPKASASICLCTHNTFDRNAFRMIGGKHKDFVCERGYIECNGFRFEGLPSFSDDKFGEERGPNTIYQFSMEGIRIAFCGSLGDIPIDWVIDKLKGVDLLFVPVGEYGTLPIYRIHEFIERVKPKVVIPTDFSIGGITLPLSPLSSYTDDLIDTEVDHVGNSIELEADDITDYTGVWIFDR